MREDEDIPEDSPISIDVKYTTLKEEFLNNETSTCDNDRNIDTIELIKGEYKYKTAGYFTENKCILFSYYSFDKFNG